MAGYENYGLSAGKLVDPSRIPHFLELAEDYPEASSTILDQNSVLLKGLTDDQRQ